MKRLIPLLCLALVLLAGCSWNAQAPGNTPTLGKTEVSGLQAGQFGLAGLPAGSKSLKFIYQLNGGVEQALPLEVPGGHAPVIARPEYNKALPAAWFQYRWVATLADGSTQTLTQGEQILNSQFTTDKWRVTRSAHVVLFAAEGASAASVEDVEQQYLREVALYDGDLVKPNSPVIIYVFRNKTDFGHFTAAANEALGVVDPGVNAAYVLSQGGAKEILRTTVHEMGHLVAGAAYGMPFFTEGLARYAEEPFIPSGEIDAYRRIVIQRMRDHNGAPHIESMDGWEMYGAGFLFVKYLDVHYGHDKFLQLLAKCREPRAIIDDVVVQVYGKTMHELDADMGKAVQAWVKGDRSLFEMTASH